MKLSVASPILLVAACIGCGWRTDNAERNVKLPADIVVSKPIFATQRFIPTNSGDVAFDTKTGSLCKTWNWELDTQDYRKNVSRYITDCKSLYFEEVREENQKIADAREAQKGNR